MTGDVSEAFGRARAALDGAPGEAAFASLMEVLAGVEGAGEVEEKLLPYCEDRLKGWPDVARALPAEDAAALVAGGWEARWALARRLTWAMKSPGDRRSLKVPARAEAFVDALERHGALTHLDLCGAQLGVEGTTRLAASSALGRVVHLDLRYNKVGDAGLEALSVPGRMRSVRTLLLRRNGIKTRGIKALAASGVGPLDRLGLGYNRAGTRSGRALVESGMLDGARYVDLGYNYMGDEVIRKLLGSGQLARVEYLNVRQNELTDAFFTHLVAAAPTKLRHLNVWNNTFGAGAEQALRAATVFGSLETLDGLDDWNGKRVRMALRLTGSYPKLTMGERVWGEQGAGPALELYG
jgi:hypothetical protein